MLSLNSIFTLFLNNIEKRQYRVAAVAVVLINSHTHVHTHVQYIPKRTHTHMNNHIYSTPFKTQERESDRRNRTLSPRHSFQRSRYANLTYVKNRLMQVLLYVLESTSFLEIYYFFFGLPV